MAIFLNLFAALCAAKAAVAASASALDLTTDLNPALQNILNQAHSGLYTYPTSLTQGIVPVSTILFVTRIDF